MTVLISTLQQPTTKTMSRHIVNICFLSFLLCLQFINAAVVNNNVVNVKVDRNIDISTQLVKINSQVVVLNKGNTPLKEYLVQFGDQKHDDSLSYISVLLVDSISKKKKPLTVTKNDKNGESVSYVVDFGSDAVKTGSSVQIEIEAIFTNLLTMYPEEIVQSDKQFVVYLGRIHFPTNYLTETQTTRVRLPSSTGVESYTKLKPVTYSDRFINYGPYDKIPPTSVASSENELRVHVENNTPFLTVKNLQRSIQVSHWAGEISIEEILDVAHNGAKLKGPFSRYEFQREPNTNGVSSIRQWRTRLPVGAQDIYYRDDIGNISTSHVQYGSQSVNVDIRPRFLLFGGWKTKYILGYTLPAQNNLFTLSGSSYTSGEYLLRIPFIDHVYDNMVLEQATVKIILPEGASNFRLKLPYDIKREENEVYYSYLDTIGRPVIVLSKKNLVEWHIQSIEISYSYKPIYMFQEPFLVVGSIFGLCLLVIGLVRTKTTLDGN